MGAGIQCFNADGSLQFDSSNRLQRFGGTQVITAGSSGSVTVPNAAEGTIWYALLPANGSWYVPGITVSGATISWAPTTIYTPAIDVTLIYGVY